MSSIYSIPKELKTKYAYLYSAEKQILSDGSVVFDKARLWDRHGINVLYLRGDRFEMAFQHGKLLGEKAKGGLEQASKMGYNNIRNSVGSGILLPIVNWYSKTFIMKKMLNYALKSSGQQGGLQLSEAYGLSESTGIPVETIIGAALSPEAIQVLLATTEQGLFAGCTTFVAWGKATADGSMIIGRNTDYPLNGFYEKYPTVIYFDPTDGIQRYMTMTSAGMHNAGVTGMNESGIYISVHTVPTLHASANGTPVFFIGQEVLKTAKTFDEAIEMLTKNHPAAGWSYDVVSFSEKKVATVEMANDLAAVRPSVGEFHVATNHWITPEMQSRNFHMNNTIDEDSRARKQRPEDMIQEEPLTVAKAIKILGDKFDPFNKTVRPFPNTVAVGDTLASSVWADGEKTVYVASGPTAPIPHTNYVSLPFVTSFNPYTFGTFESKVIDNSQWAKEYPGQAKAEQMVIEAKKAFEYNNDAETSLKYLRLAVEAYEGEPAAHILVALMAIRTGRLYEAKLSCEKILLLGYDKQRVLLAHYVLGRIYADRGMKAEAKKELNLVLSDPSVDNKLTKASKSVLWWLKLKGSLKLNPYDITIMMFVFGDGFHYKGMLEF